MKIRNVVLAGLITVTAAFTQENFGLWSYYKTLKLNTTASGASVTTAQINFPVLVRLTAADSAVFSGSRRLGSDLRFTKANGVRLKHELEYWDSAGRSASIWVRLDTVKGNDSTFFRMYWGKIGAPDSSKGSAVFDTADGYRAVWHLSETAGPSKDATILASPAIWNDADGTRLTSVPGRAGRALNFANGTGTTGDVGAYLSSSYNSVNNNFKVSSARGLTLSTWINRPAVSFGLVGAIGIVGRFSYTGGNFRQYSLSANNGATYQVQARVSSDGLDGASETFISQAASANNTWYQVTGTYVNGSQLLYRNGVSVGTPATRASLPALDSAWANSPFAIAKLDAATTNAQHWNGIIDEVRLFHGVRSADWIRLEYQNQQAADSLLIGGLMVTQQTGAPANLTYATSPVSYTTLSPITPNAASVTGVVDSFTITPALPAGLVLSKTTGAISGTPTAVSAAANYTVTARNGSGTATVQVNLTVTPLPVPSAFSYKINPVVYTVNAFIAPDTAVVTGVVDSFTVSPALPNFLQLDKSTGIITGIPIAAAAAASYTVTARNASGTATVQLNVTVNPAGLAFTPGAAWKSTTVARVGRGLLFKFPAGNDAARLAIVDMHGRTIWSRNIAASGGVNEAAWNGVAQNGGAVAGGIYTVRITAGAKHPVFEQTIVYAP